MREKPVVGQELILCSLDSRRDSRRYRLVKVTKVGRKYFEIDYPLYRSLKFHISDWSQENGDYSPHYSVCAEREELQNQIISNLATKTLQQYFSQHGRVPATADELLKCCSVLGLYDDVTAKLAFQFDKLDQQLGG